jgi:hypothetical protein
MLTTKFIKLPPELVIKIKPLDYRDLMTKEWVRLKNTDPYFNSDLEEYLEDVPPYGHLIIKKFTIKTAK